jgi:signal transduction histidine kinase/ActR/RegA family two-component response regulator
MPQPDPRAVARIRSVCIVAGCVALTVGALAIASYPLGNPWLRTFGRTIAVQPNTAAGMLCAAGALLFGQIPRGWGRIVAWFLSGVVALLGGATLFEHVTGVDLGIDRLVFPDMDIGPTTGTRAPGRMGPPAALSFLVAGLVGILLDARSRGVRFVAQSLALGAVPVPLLGLVGHAYDVTLLYGAPTATAIALPTAMAVLAIDVGLLCARPDRGFVANLASSGAGSAFARRMLVYALAVPVALGWLALAVSGAGREAAFAVSVLVVALSLVFFVLVVRDALAIERLEADRVRAERERELSREELARALEREREARAHAEAASRAKDQFLATLSHELRTPLNAILGWAGLLREAADPERVARGLAVVERNGRALAQLVSDLLDMSRLAAGDMEVVREDVDLLSAVDEAVESVRPAARAKGVSLTRAAGPELPRVHGDRARLRQVAWNLLSNAVKFTPSGGAIDVRLGIEEGRAVLEVADTGIGMTPEVLSAVFDPFVQADASPARRHGGLGLGLAICRELVELHGGTIGADSEGPGRGTTFRVSLPAAPRVAPVAPGPAGSRPDLRGARVLVVDDEDDSRDLLLQLLASWGAQPTGAASAREALEAIARERPDLVVSDIAMPGEDGLAFIRDLRRSEAKSAERRVPVAALTAFARADDRDRTLAAGFDAHLAKPVEPAALLATMLALLRGPPAARVDGARAAGGRAAGGAPSRA